ncbi:D-alanyl-D-alanine carboxypeptidase [Cerasibacillus terrae]|uniref:serine-type D-Ala-D-Ala carboxypeptidase n=1 Tax=Cerasibacillus terrae TaxID=2498845 RepID=A0A5C8P3M1_9BACI|nr:D-alanyl-D-alanine carboxypeptidase family protein [Cerasibacillus terrae]TXL67904.1 D-alanyl-D-alanine carboxypeptidase [Cerasibacillus terrae]
MKNKIVLFFSLCIVFLVLSFQIPVFAEEEKNELELAPDAQSAILMERDTGKIMFDKNAHKKLPPASMVKIMTLLLIMEQIDKGELKKEEMVRISENAASMGGSQVFLENGEEMSVDDLIKAVAIASGNDASVALAERIAGSEEAFVAKMNQKAEALQLKNTVFKNVTGLPVKGQYSTAHDMAIIAKELLKYEDITTYTSIYEDYLRKGEKNEFWLVNTNKLVHHYQGVDGLKTGYTNEAKYCLTATAEKNEMRVITVVMGAETIKKRNKMTSNMLDYAFNQYETNQLYKKGEKVEKLQLLKGDNKNVNIVTSQSISTLFKKAEPLKDVKTEMTIQDDFQLPLKKGDKVGVLKIMKGDKTLSETPLVVDADVNKASFLTLFKRTIQNMSKAP